MSVFAQAVGADFAGLPPALQQFHAGGPAQRRFTGHATVEHGCSIAAQIGIKLGGFPPPGCDIAAQIGIKLGGFPPPGCDMPFAITVTHTEQEEYWARDFDGHITRSTLWYDPARQQVIENLGRVTCALDLTVTAGQLNVDVTRLWLLGLPIPAPFVPRSNSREWQDETGAFCFDISAQLPGGAALIRYHGRLVPQL